MVMDASPSECVLLWVLVFFFVFAPSLFVSSSGGVWGRLRNLASDDSESPSEWVLLWVFLFFIIFVASDFLLCRGVCWGEGVSSPDRDDREWLLIFLIVTSTSLFRVSNSWPRDRDSGRVGRLGPFLLQLWLLPWRVARFLCGRGWGNTAW